MQECRLFRILYYLLDKKQVTAVELSNQLEVSVRTIYRDLDVISQAGIPIYTTVGRSGGICIKDGYSLHHLLLSDEEKQLLLQSLQQLQAIGIHDQEETLQKLRALFQVTVPNWLQVDFSQWGDATNSQMDITVFKQAIFQSEKLSFRYVNAKGEVQKRIVHPITLLYKSMHWYLQAFCEYHQAMRIFKIHRMQEIKNLHETFLPHDPVVLKSYPKDQLIEVTLRCSSKLAYRIYDEFTYDTITRQEDGQLLIHVFMPDAHWLVSYLLSFGHHLEIVEPSFLCVKLLEEIEAINRNYKKP